MTTVRSEPRAKEVVVQLPQVGERLEDEDVWVEVFASAPLPTRFGDFHVMIFRTSIDEKEQVALIKGDVAGHEDVLVRLHSECLTGDVLGSLRCDCRHQLEMALEAVGNAKNGVVLYLRQEGRGIGLGNKVRAYSLQDQGLDTFQANERLGFEADMRDYRVAALILRTLKITSVHLATNNPRKVFGLRAHGVDVSARVPLVVETNPHNAVYLQSKAKFGHILPKG